MPRNSPSVDGNTRTVVPGLLSSRLPTLCPVGTLSIILSLSEISTGTQVDTHVWSAYEQEEIRLSS